MGGDGKIGRLAQTKPYWNYIAECEAASRRGCGDAAPSPLSKGFGRRKLASTMPRQRARAPKTRWSGSPRGCRKRRNKLADTERQMRSAEARAMQAEKAVTQINDAIRAQLLGLQRSQTNVRATSTVDPRSGRGGEARQAIG